MIKMDSEVNYSYLDENVGKIKKKILAAAKRSERQEGDIVLMSAVKSATVEEINYIHRSLGINDIGENRVQQLLERWDKLDKEDLRVHFIGSLQTNKVKYIIDKVYMIHSLDSERLAAEIDKQAKKHGIVANVLVEINSGSEENKGGIAYEDIESFCLSLARFENIKLCGFMTMAPKCENKADYYPYFRKTKEVAEHVWHNVLGRNEKPIISMGMSESYEEAIESGATMVRVGRSMFAK
ncbi:MAG: YggS family pyridoxal phosphate-dependent enzyme [Clostridia bacterium]|nr:YggS family pyridoxal phosphate-dependent enzyme [Clostridia bacterium]